MRRFRVPLSKTTLTVIGEEPYSRSARLGRNLGAFAVLFALIALLFHSFAVVDTPTFLAAFIAALAIGTVAILFSARAFSIIWARGKRGLGDAILGLSYGAMLWLVPLAIFTAAQAYPQVSDVVTQSDVVPEFLAVDGVRPGWANPVDLDTARPAPLARPLTTDVPLNEVYGMVLDLAESSGWTVIADNPPDEKKPALAVVQAAATSAFGFTDDVVILLRTIGKRTHVDMRSSSRIGKFDLGINQRRIDDFMLALRQKLNER